MIDKNSESDNWGQLLSDFGIEDNTPQEVAEPEAPRPATAAGQPKELPEPPESQEPKEKKSMFSRFPKINFFGTPPEVSFEAVIEGTRSPSVGGKAFTDNKLEKMPVSQERTDRQKKSWREKETAREPDAWATVASQIDVLASNGDAETLSEERPARRSTTSMFDDPIPESEEFRALKDLMGEQPRREESRRDAFLEEGTGFRQRGRGRYKPPSEEKEVRGRGSRYSPPVEVDDLPETDFESFDDEAPVVTRGRGQRGSRYAGGGYRDQEPIRDDVPQEEWSEVDAALQAGQGGRHQRYDKRRRPERADRMEKPRIDRESMDGEDSGVVAIHNNVPSWDDAIGDIIAGNIVRHKAHSGRGRR